MKGLYLWLATIFLSGPVFAQFADDFSDGDFSHSPIWKGDTAYFTVNLAKQLQSNGPNAASTLYLSTPNTQWVSTEWQFSVSLNFSPTNANHARVYLMSDQADLKGSLNGYYVRIGEDGTADGVDLYRQQGSTHTKLIDGVAGRAATNPNLRIKVIRDATGNWKLYSDNTGGTNFQAEGSATDNTVTGTTYMGVYCTFSSTRRQGFFFDNFLIQDAPITLVKADPVGGSQVKVFFSTSLEVSSATLAANYSFSNNLEVQSAWVDPVNPTQVVLNLTQPLQSGTFTLSISNVKDLNGNTLPPNSVAPFTYVVPVTYREIVINEMLVDESPRVDLPQAEFVELFNATDRTINLKGCTLADPSTSVALPDYNLPPNGFVILCKNTFLPEFEAYGPTIGLSSWPSLNNTSDVITLKSLSGTLIDRVSYTDQWYTDSKKAEGGWTLEQVNPFTPCSNYTNWQASTQVTGGTPGKTNSIYSDAPDAVPPRLATVKATDAYTLVVQFNEPMDSISLKNGLYQIDKETSVRKSIPVYPDYTSVQLILDRPLADGTVYQLTIEHVSDCEGNPLGRKVQAVGVGTMPQYNQLLLTEIMADEDPVMGLPKAEFVELYNASDRVLSLSGLTFTDATSTARFPDGVIFPQEYIILTASTAVPLFQPYGRVISLAGFSLNNSGELLTLHNAKGATVYSVEYKTDWYGDPKKADGGWALEMVDVQNPCREAGNWAASVNPAGGSPGQPNSVAASRPDLTPPHQISVEVLDSKHLLVSFPEKMDSLTMSQPDQYALDKGMAITSAAPVGPAFQKVQLALKADLLVKTIYSLTVHNAQDCAGNVNGGFLKASFALPQPGDSGDIVLNEVLFNPLSGGVDFVEIYNRSDKFVDLQNWQVANAKDAQPANQKDITDQHRVLVPGSYAVLTTNGQVLKDQYPRAKDSTFIIMSALPSFPDESGSVIVLNNQHAVVDRFDYDEKFHFPLIDRQEGVSLERINTETPGNIPQNWHSAASTAGYATPGYRNSQILNSGKPTSQFKMQPPVFTPDEDGYNDFTTLQYAMENRGCLATVTIFDAVGREVRQLARNELLGMDGFYTWDGTDSRGEKVRTGRYVIYISLFDLQGKQQQFKEEVIVGTKF